MTLQSEIKIHQEIIMVLGHPGMLNDVWQETGAAFTMSLAVRADAMIVLKTFLNCLYPDLN
jgi:hypothetical protein